MNPLADGSGGYLLLMAAGVLVHEPWRWLGLLLGRNIDPHGEVFRWVRAVSASLVAGLVMRLLLFPTGALAAVGLPARVLAFLAGIAVFFFMGRALAAGIGAGAIILSLVQMTLVR